MQVREIWRPKRMTASGTLVEEGGMISGFLCTTGGTVVISKGIESGGDEVVSSITVTAGTWYPMPFRFDTGAYAALGGGAVVTFGIG